MSLDEDTRRLVAGILGRRAAVELLGAAAFETITRALFELRAEAPLIGLSAGAICDELRHAELYRGLAESYAREPVILPRPAPIAVPAHLDAPEELRPALRVIGMCAINETIACGFLELCLLHATEDPVRSVLRTVLGDEVRHGRIGWAWLGSIPPSERLAVSPWVLPLCRVQLRAWREQIALGPERAAPEHGCPEPARIEEATVSALRDLVLPGFAHVGVEVAEAEAWLSAGAPG